MRCEPFKQLFSSRAEWRAVPVGDQVMDSKKLPCRPQPAQDGPHIQVALAGINSAEQRVLKNPVKLLARLVAQEIHLLKPCLQSSRRGAFAREPHRARRNVQPGRSETGARPS